MERIVVDPNDESYMLQRILCMNPDYPIRIVAFSPDGQVLAAGMDFRVFLWRVADGMPLRVLEGHEHLVQSVAFSPRWADHSLGSK